MMASKPPTSTTTLLPPDAKPPKSKSATYYAIHPHWQDVTPIPQVDQTGTLAPIAYSQRYSEAMSYLRALMADNEVSERALNLTEDLISMNPAHYTVWIYRMQVLRALWSASKGDPGSALEVSELQAEQEKSHLSTSTQTLDEGLWTQIQKELTWLDDVSFRNLKNYQIWHHRQGLADLLPGESRDSPSDEASSQESKVSDLKLSPETHETLSNFVASEQTFLARILSLDTKNYHVWSYRQWLCSRFPSFLFPSYTNDSKDGPAGDAQTIAHSYRSHSEVAAIDTMIEEDVRNNSAWSHRYFILFGHHELTYAQSQTPPIVLKTVNDQKLLHKVGLLDMPLVEAEIEYTKEQINKAPQNGSTWNYLKGVLQHGAIDVVSTRDFCESFLGPDGDLWMDQWVDIEIEDSQTGKKRTERQKLGVQSSHAIEWLSEIHGKDGTDQGRKRSKECFKALSEKWDVIRKGYWDFRIEKLEESWAKQSDHSDT